MGTGRSGTASKATSTVTGQCQESLEAGPPDGDLGPSRSDDCLGPEWKLMPAGDVGHFLERGRHGDLGAGLGPLGAVKLTLGALRAAGCCPCSATLGAGPHRLVVVEGPPPASSLSDSCGILAPGGRIGCPGPGAL